MKPQRIQLSRAKGFNLQSVSMALNGLPAVKVSRPGKWGNPFDFRRSECCWAALSFGCKGDAHGRQQASVLAFREWIDPPFGRRTLSSRQQSTMGELAIGPEIVAGEAPSRTEIVEELRGKNLACWCAAEPCHASVLLEIANPAPLDPPSPPEGK